MSRLLRPLAAVAVALLGVVAAAPTASAASEVKTGFVTGYTIHDNDPAGRAIAYPGTFHAQAGGTGTYDDPITLAAQAGDYAPGHPDLHPACRPVLRHRGQLRQLRRARRVDRHVDRWRALRPRRGHRGLRRSPHRHPRVRGEPAPRSPRRRRTALRLRHRHVLRPHAGQPRRASPAASARAGQGVAHGGASRHGAGPRSRAGDDEGARGARRPSAPRRLPPRHRRPRSPRRPRRRGARIARPARRRPRRPRGSPRRRCASTSRTSPPIRWWRPPPTCGRASPRGSTRFATPSSVAEAPPSSLAIGSLSGLAPRGLPTAPPRRASPISQPDRGAGGSYVFVIFTPMRQALLAPARGENRTDAPPAPAAGRHDHRAHRRGLAGARCLSRCRRWRPTLPPGRSPPTSSPEPGRRRRTPRTPGPGQRQGHEPHAHPHGHADGGSAGAERAARARTRAPPPTRAPPLRTRRPPTGRPASRRLATAATPRRSSRLTSRPRTAKGPAKVATPSPGTPPSPRPPSPGPMSRRLATGSGIPERTAATPTGATAVTHEPTARTSRTTSPRSSGCPTCGARSPPGSTPSGRSSSADRACRDTSRSRPPGRTPQARRYDPGAVRRRREPR